jgi:hypothetical protein
MKKLLLAALSLTIIFSSCKKDKEYGFSADASPKGVSFNQAVNLAAGTKASDSISIVSGVSPKNTPQTTTDVYITLEATQVSTSDVTISLKFRPDLVPQGYTKLTIAQVQVPATIKIPAGAQFVQVPITFPNTSAFLLTDVYALGLEMSSVDQGFQVAANRRLIVVAYNVLNQWDGVYKLDWTNYHPTSNPGYTGGTREVELRTSGTFTCKIFYPEAGIYANPALLNGNITYFGAQEPEYTFAPTSPTAGTISLVRNADGTGPVYALSSAFASNYALDPVLNKTIINVKWGYNNPGGVFSATATREWTQKFTFLRPR